MAEAELQIPKEPRINVKQVARIFRAPGHVQMRELRLLKFPPATDKFRIPYYQPSLLAINNYFKDGRSLKALNQALAKVQNINNVSRSQNNERLLHAFIRSDMAKRNLHPTDQFKVTFSVDGIEIRLSPDLIANENGSTRYIFLHCSHTAIADDLARVTLEIGLWVLKKAGISAKMTDLELIDLSSNKTYLYPKSRKTTVSQLEETIELFRQLWPGLEPK